MAFRAFFLTVGETIGARRQFGLALRRFEHGQLSLSFESDSNLEVGLRGICRLRSGVPPITLVQREPETARAQSVAFDAGELGSWDRSVLIFLGQISELCRQRQVPRDRAGLPAGVQKLLALFEGLLRVKHPRAA